MGWRDTITNGADAKPSWRDTIKAPGSAGNSAGRGGAFEAAKDWFTNTGEGVSPSKRVEFGGYPAAALRQFGAGASGDWKDEAQGLLEKAGGGDYVKGRDEARQIEVETEKQYPTTSKIAHFAGSVVSPLMRLGAPIASGLMGLGASKADLTKGDAEENTQALRDTIYPALTGKALSNAGEKVAPWLDKAKTALAGRHIRMTPAIRRAVGREAADAAANEAVDSGAIQWGHKVDDTADNLKGLVEKVGAEKGAMVDAAEKTASPVDVANKIEQEVIIPLEQRSSAGRQAAKPLREQLARFVEQHAPDYNPERPEGTPTTITRKSQFVPQSAEIVPSEVGAYPTSMPRVPDRPVRGQGPQKPPPSKSVTQTTSTFHPDEIVGYDKYTGAPQFRRDVHDVVGASTGPLETQETLAASSPFKLDPDTGLPVKQMVEKRIGGSPEAQRMSARSVEQEKTDAQAMINWATDGDLVKEGKQSFSRALKDVGEGLVDDPKFVPVKQRYGRLKTAQLAADRTASLTDGGGLMGHLTDLNVGHVALEELMKSNPKGLALLAARGLIKGRMSSAGAVSAKAVADAIKRGDLNFVKNLAPVVASGSYGLLKAARDE